MAGRLIPEVDEHINNIINKVNEIENKISFMEENINVVGSNANIFLGSVFTTTNITGMYNYLKASSNDLTPLES